MQFKQSGKHLFGVSFSKKEQEILDVEIQKYLDERLGEILRSFSDDVDREVLYFLLTECGHDREQLETDYFTFSDRLDELISHYEMKDGDCSWLCDYELKKIGIDILELKKRRLKE